MVDHFKYASTTPTAMTADDHVIRSSPTASRSPPGGGTSLRYGGEEFALVFPGKVRTSDARISRKLREIVETSRFTHAARFGRGSRRTEPTRGRKDPYGDHDHVSSVWRNGTPKSVSRSGREGGGTRPSTGQGGRTKPRFLHASLPSSYVPPPCERQGLSGDRAPLTLRLEGDLHALSRNRGAPRKTPGKR